MSIELLHQEWFEQQDQDDEWIANQELADKEIFRDQCRSAIENADKAWYVVSLWSTEEWERAHLVTHGGSMFLPPSELRSELDFLSTIAGRRMTG